MVERRSGFKASIERSLMRSSASKVVCIRCEAVVANRSMHLGLRELGRSQISVGRSNVAVINYQCEDCASFWQQWDTGDWYPGNHGLGTTPRG